ncbi:hypothetical protein [Leuconostoc pseudomesenteroides]|uniref:hypothetical protein n=1 Tax=Leuconostoc pseudomesenteroides TaxID=33968 RepID=UPI0032DEEE38
MVDKQTGINEDDGLIEDAAELLKTGVFKNDLSLRRTITMFQRRFRIGWHRGFNLARVLRDRSLLVNPSVDEEISEELSK